jgi:hypothetical protein
MYNSGSEEGSLPSEADISEDGGDFYSDTEPARDEEAKATGSTWYVMGREDVAAAQVGPPPLRVHHLPPAV